MNKLISPSNIIWLGFGLLFLCIGGAIFHNLVLVAVGGVCLGVFLCLLDEDFFRYRW